MRNLKRALSLTLASVMLLGMMVVGTSALSFNDADDISNVTAASVLEDLGIMQGDGSGNFMPDKAVTRAQMAIIVCRILYGNKLNVSQFEGTTQYTDVGANDYYTGYINLATQLGIIGGYGDGRFGPNDTVTTAQAALMLSRALGYFKGSEIAQAQDWALASVAQASKINMFGDLKLSTNAELARDNVAEMVFNTITKAVPVQYNELLGVYYNENKGIVYALTFYYTDTLGYKNFDLVYRTNETTDYGRPGTTWGTGRYNGSSGTSTSGNDAYGLNEDGSLKPGQVKMLAQDEIITVAYTPDYVYTGNTKQDKVYKDLGKNVCDPKAKNPYTWTFYVDGDLKSDSESQIPVNDDVNWQVGTPLATRFSGNGAVTEVYVDSVNQTVRVVTIWNYMAQVMREREDKDGRYIDVRVEKCGYDLDTKYYTANFAEEDYIIINIDNHERDTRNNDDEYFIQDACETGKVEGDVKQVRKWTDKDGDKDGDYVVLDDSSKNTYSLTNWFDLEELNENHPDLDTAYRLYLDPNGFVVGFEATADISRNYLYVTDAHDALGVTAKVVFADGTSARIDVDDKFTNHKLTSSTTSTTSKDEVEETDLLDKTKDHALGTATGDDKFDDPDVNQRVFRYSVDKDGTYTLTQLGDSRASIDVYVDAKYPVADNGTDKTKTITNGAAYITADGNTRYIVDKKTAFVDVEDKTLYTGFEEVPSYYNASFYVVDVKKDGVADVVFIFDGKAVNDNSTYIFVSDWKDFVSENKDKTVAIQWSSYIDGDKVTDGLRIDYEEYRGEIAAGKGDSGHGNGLYKVDNTDKDGIITDVTFIGDLRNYKATYVGNSSFYTTQTPVGSDAKDTQWIVDKDTIFVTVDEDNDNVRRTVGPRGLKDIVKIADEKVNERMTNVYVAKYSDDGKIAKLVYILEDVKGASQNTSISGVADATGTDFSNIKPGDTVTFKVTAKAGYENVKVFFNGDEITPDAEGNYTVKVPSNGKFDLSATADTVKYDLTINATNVTVTVKDADNKEYVNGDKVAYGTKLTITATNDNGWTVTKNVTGLDDDSKVIGDVTVTASATDPSIPEGVVITFDKDVMRGTEKSPAKVGTIEFEGDKPTDDQINAVIIAKMESMGYAYIGFADDAGASDNTEAHIFQKGSNTPVYVELYKTAGGAKPVEKVEVTGENLTEVKDKIAGGSSESPVKVVVNEDVDLSTTAIGAGTTIEVAADATVTIGGAVTDGAKITGEGTVEVAAEATGTIEVDVPVVNATGAIKSIIEIAEGAKIEITLEEQPGSGGKIVVGDNATVTINAPEAGLPASAVTFGENAKVTIKGDLVLASAKRVRESTALTISGEVTVTGKVGAGVVVTITAEGTLTVEGEVEADAQITTKSQKGFQVGASTKVNEAITLALDNKNVQLTDVTKNVVYKIGEPYSWPSDVSPNTVFVAFDVPKKAEGAETGASWHGYVTEDGKSEKLWDTEKADQDGGKYQMMGYYFSLSAPSSDGQEVTPNPITKGEHYTVTIVDGYGETHSCGFTAWEGASAGGAEE